MCVYYIIVTQVKGGLRVGKWILLPVVVTIVLISWIASGVALAAGLMASDLCINPRQVCKYIHYNTLYIVLSSA
jgi:uncharacterized membrane protein